MREFGRLDILVNNASTNAPYGPLMEADPGEWRHAFTARTAPARRLCCTSQQLAGELAPGVHANAVSPAPVRTEIARFV
ncbi:hypothetical protein [Streptomyces sp. NPDC002402]